MVNQGYLTLSVGLVVLSLAASAVAEDNQNTGSCKPQHVHLSLGEAADQVNVLWATQGQCSSPPPAVIFGTTMFGLNERAEGESATLPHNPRGLQNLHRVTLKGLEGETSYFYRPLSGGASGTPSYFKSLDTSTNGSRELLVVGSLGDRSELIPVLQQIAVSGQYSAALQLGGLGGYFSEPNSTKGDELLQELEQVAAFLPYMTAAGDNETADDATAFLNYRYRFSMPGSAWPIPEDKLWYSFNMGPVHFVSICTDVYLRGSRQLQQMQSSWLEKDLNEAHQMRDKRPWIVAFGQHPLYCSGPSTADCSKKVSLVRAGLEDKLYYFGVDVVLQSQNEAGGGYERLFPTFKDVGLAPNYTNPRAPVHIVLGPASPLRFPHPTAPTQEPGVANASATTGVNKTEGAAGSAALTTVAAAAAATTAPVSDGDGASGGTVVSAAVVASPVGNTTVAALTTAAAGKVIKDAAKSPPTSDTKDVDKFAFKMINGTYPTYGRLRIVNATHAQWELLAGSTFTGEDGAKVEVGAVLDSLWIVQEKHNKFQLAELPKEVETKINQNMVESGGQPGVLNVHDPASDRKRLLVSDNNFRLVLAASFGGFVLFLLLVALVVRLTRRKARRKVARRWDSMDYKYGKTKLYTAGPDDDELDGDEEDNDFEVDISDGSQGQTTKLINGK